MHRGLKISMRGPCPSSLPRPTCLAVAGKETAPGRRLGSVQPIQSPLRSLGSRAVHRRWPGSGDETQSTRTRTRTRTRRRTWQGYWRSRGAVALRRPEAALARVSGGGGVHEGNGARAHLNLVRDGRRWGGFGVAGGSVHGGSPRWVSPPRELQRGESRVCARAYVRVLECVHARVVGKG